jgi:hypothetical protein
MNILIIPEDFRKDQYILQPIIKSLIDTMGRRRVRVEVCKNPLLGGISQAMNLERLSEIIEQYPMVDIFLLCVDRDGDEHRRTALDNIERQMERKLNRNQFFLSENAWQELEVWVLAGHDLERGWRWQEIRTERDPKEQYFYPLARLRRLENTPGEGRKVLSEEAARRIDRIIHLCPEDVENLLQRIMATGGFN